MKRRPGLLHPRSRGCNRGHGRCAQGALCGERQTQERWVPGHHLPQWTGYSGLSAQRVCEEREDGCDSERDEHSEKTTFGRGQNVNSKEQNTMKSNQPTPLQRMTP